MKARLVKDYLFNYGDDEEQIIEQWEKEFSLTYIDTQCGSDYSRHFYKDDKGVKYNLVHFFDKEIQLYRNY